MGKIKGTFFTLLAILLLSLAFPLESSADEVKKGNEHQERSTNINLMDINEKIRRFVYDSGLHFE